MRPPAGLWYAFIVVALASACGGPSKPPESALPAASEWHTFAGTWSGSGERVVLQLGPDHHASVFNLTGSLLLKGETGLGVGFQGKAIGFSDNLTGSTGRCVWTDEHGDQVFSELKGEQVGTDRHISGTIIGGTGRYANITGTYEFTWQFVVELESGLIQGRTNDIKGRFRTGPPIAAGEPRQ